MKSSDLLEIITIYAPAIVILLLSGAAVFRIIRRNIRKKREQVEASEKSEVAANSLGKHAHISEVPGRVLHSSDLDQQGSTQNSVIMRMEKLTPLKQGIIWAEILGRPGGRRRRNT